MTTWLDYTFLAFLAVLFPILGRGSLQRMRKRMALGEIDVRIRSYRRTMFLEWSLLAVVLFLWLWDGRSPEALGFVPAAGWRFGLGAGVVVVAATLLAWQAWRLPWAGPEHQKKVRSQLEPVRDFLPQTRRELRSFWSLSVSAGICEEVVYRGFLMWLLGGLGGTWLAVLGSAAVFALGHSYQGASGVVRVFLVGLGMAVLYLGSGSLWAPIVLHAVGDILQGWLAYRALTGSPAPPTALPTPPEATS